MSDELASFNKLLRLPTAITENRKYGNPVVLDFRVGASSKSGTATITVRVK